MLLHAVADAGDLAARLVEALGLGVVLREALLEGGLEDALARFRVPNMDAFLIEGCEATKNSAQRSAKSRFKATYLAFGLYTIPVATLGYGAMSSPVVPRHSSP